MTNAPETSWDARLEQFARYQRAGGLSEKTIANRAECFQLLAVRSGRAPEEVTADDVLNLMTRLHKGTGLQLSPNTKQAERSYLKSFFGWMLQEEYRDDDPTARLLKVKIPRRRPRPFRRSQVDELLDSGAYTRTRDMITIAALSGLRIGEIVRIRGEDVDLVEGSIFTIRKGGLQHTVPLHPALSEMAARYPAKGWWFPSPYKSAKFPNGSGHILMASASDAISKAIRRANISDQRLTGHSLRHFYATQLLREGVNVRIIQEVMGHASLATTQLYMDVTDVERAEGVQRLEPFQTRAHSARKRVKFTAE